VTAARADGVPVVRFVCRHGAAKSVLAAADFRSLAAERGLTLRAESFGLRPDPKVAPTVVDALLGEGIDMRAIVPQRLGPSEVTAAWRLITFDLDPSDLPAPRADLDAWDDVPAVSADLEAARAAIHRHLRVLIDDAAGHRQALSNGLAGPPRGDGRRRALRRFP
jgi:arsenate reductase